MLKKASRNVLALTSRRESAPADGVAQRVRSVFHQQAQAIADLAARVDESYANAVEILFRTRGKVIVIGVGKSGLVGRKIAATLASTGTPSFFVHGGEAHHGDLGMISADDSVILISHSGETDEVVGLIPHLRRSDVPIIAITGSPGSSLANGAEVVLDSSVEVEACPNNLAPTNSTLTAMAVGDALAVALMLRRQFTASDFAKNHPGGRLGQKLVQVRDAMRTSDLPVVAPTDTIGECLVPMTEGRLGLVLVMSGERLVGLVTDGDLRRALQHFDDLMQVPVSEIMTQNPVTVPEDLLLVDAHRRMQQMKLKALVVEDARGKVSGVIEVFEE